MAQMHLVEIRKDVNNPKRCTANRFQAERGDIVKFVFPGEPRSHIKFNGASPFGESEFDLRPGPDTGVAGVAIKTVTVEGGSFEYDITWPGEGQGNGGGDVKGSRAVTAGSV